MPYIEHREKSTLNNLLYAGRYIYNKTAFRNLVKLLKVYRPDIAHLHLFYGDLSASILKALKQEGIPVVLSVHDYRLLCPANALLDASNTICEECRDKAYYKCARKRCLEGNFFFSSVLALEGYYRKYFIDPLDCIDRFIFVSKFAERKHIEFDKRFEPKSEQLYNFTDLESPGVKSGKGGYFLFFGRLSQEKGLKTLLAAVSKTNLNLKIAGSGPLESEVRIHITQHNNTTFLGHQSGSELGQLVSQASFVIVPSEWYENNPMTIIEAYAAGVPVIASRIGGIPEIVEHKKTGFLFEAHDVTGLTDALQMANGLSSNDYTELSLSCREFALHNFSSVTHYSHLMDIYAKALRDV